MVLISRKVDYAMLALCSIFRRQSCSAREIAAEFGVPRPFLAKILKELCRSGLITGQRGLHGGYLLATDPDEITVERIISVFHGDLRLVSCCGESSHDKHAKEPSESVSLVEGNTDAEGECGLQGSCPVRGPLHVLHERMIAVLAGVTVRDLAQYDLAMVPLSSENANQW